MEDDNVEIIEEEGEGGAGEGGAKVGGAEGEDTNYYTPYFEPSWDSEAPKQGYAYSPEVLTKERWESMLDNNPTAVAQLPDGHESIVRVPAGIAAEVADVAGGLPPLTVHFGDNIEKGVWVVNWDKYLRDNYKAQQFEPTYISLICKPC